MRSRRRSRGLPIIGNRRIRLRAHCQEDDGWFRNDGRLSWFLAGWMDGLVALDGFRST